MSGLGPATGVSVVIPTRDKPASLRVTLACLAAQRDLSAAQVVLVDDGVGEQTSAVAREAGAYLDLLVVPGPHRGRAAARNAGARRASHELLVFVDDDILVGDRFLAAHQQAAADDAFTHGPLREMAAAARWLRQVDGASLPDVRAARDRILAGTAGPLYRLVPNSLERTVAAMADGELPDVAPWLGSVGGNVGMPRRAWEAAGGYDEDFGRDWGCEDLELGLRLHRMGLRRRLVAGAAGVHLSHARPGRWEEHERTLGHFTRKHPIASVRALPALLSVEGTPRSYVETVRALTERPSDDSPRTAGAGRRHA
jgi:glycosyltransferase involved in cell wall biosynthesis